VNTAAKVIAKERSEGPLCSIFGLKSSWVLNWVDRSIRVLSMHLPGCGSESRPRFPTTSVMATPFVMQLFESPALQLAAEND
jgi:hypothetical protein